MHEETSTSSIWSKGVSQTATAICRSPYCWLRFFREWSTRHDRLVDYSHAEVTIRPDGCRQETRSQVTGLAQEITQTGRTQTHNREQCVHLRLCGRIGKTCFFLFFLFERKDMVFTQTLKLMTFTQTSTHGRNLLFMFERKHMTFTLAFLWRWFSACSCTGAKFWT